MSFILAFCIGFAAAIISSPKMRRSASRLASRSENWHSLRALAFFGLLIMIASFAAEVFGPRAGFAYGGMIGLVLALPFIIGTLREAGQEQS